MHQAMHRSGAGRLAALAAMGILMLMAATAALGQTVTFTADTPAGCGELLTAEVRIDAAVLDVRAFSFVLTYDQTLITPVAVMGGDLLQTAACDTIVYWIDKPGTGGHTSDGTIEVDGAILGCSVGGAGALLEILFVDAGIKGTSALGASTHLLRDSGNAQIAHTFTAGSGINACNHLPTAVNDGPYLVDEGGTLTVTTPTLLANDGDPDSDGLTAVLAAGPANDASFTLNSDGTFTYTHDGSETTSDSFTYYANDGTANSATPATVSITVTPVNDAPVAVDDGPYVVDEGGTLTVTTPTLLANDTDPDSGTLTAVLAVGPVNDASFTLNSDGTFTYTHDGSETTSDSFTYYANDGIANSDTPATVSITVTPVNDPPVAVADGPYTVDEGGVLNATSPTVLANDTDAESNPLTAALAAGPSHATSFTLYSDGTFDYTHDGSETTSDSFTYYANDGTANSDTPATVSITVTPVNDAPVITNPGLQTSTENDTVDLPIEFSDADGSGTYAWTASSLPTGLSIDSGDGTISGTITCNTGVNVFHVQVTLDDGSGEANSSDTVNFDWNIEILDQSPPITDLLATPIKTGNGTDGTTRIMVSWTTAVGALDQVQVWRKGYGGYPEYDDSTGVEITAAPASPTAAMADGWSRISTDFTSGGTDEPPVRDFWYYVAFVDNACGNASGVSNLPVGQLNYYLGDIGDPGAPPAYGDNAVGFSDISLLGAHYATTELLNPDDYLDWLDVGPTTDFSVDALPTTDDAINFEDLIMFALNYGDVSKALNPPAPAAADLLTLFVPETQPQGEELELTLQLAGAGDIQGLSVMLDWDPAVVEPLGMTPGDLMSAQGGQVLVLEPAPGGVDAALFGLRNAGGITGEGVLATLRFRKLSEGDAAFGFATVTARDAENQALPLATSLEFGTPESEAVPAVSLFYGSYPNPFNPKTTLAYGLSAAGHVKVTIFAVDGRLVRTLVEEHQSAGRHEAVWDGRSDSGQRMASGAYLARLEASDRTQTLRLLLLK